MSAAPSTGAPVPTAKAVSTDKSADAAKDQKTATMLEEDDEFEDFPVESRFYFLSWGLGVGMH